MIRLLFVCACVALCASASAAPPAPAAAKSGDAKALYKSGTQHYNLAEFDQALADFKEAYRLRSDPVFLFNIAQCHRRLNNPSDAATFYRSFLREAPNAPNRAEVERVLAEMDAQVQAKDAERARSAEAEKARNAQAARDAEAAARASNGADLAVTASAPAPKKPLVKKPWFWVAVIGGAAVVATGVAVGVVFGTPPKNPSSTYSVQVH
jgi:tetratricopeptide (TPR) repeat protein